MKRLLLLSIILILAACGGTTGGNGDGVTFSTAVEILCMDIVNSQDELCSPLDGLSAAAVFDDVIYDAGDVSVLTTMYNITDVRNAADGIAPVYYYTEYIYNGCAGLLNYTQTYRLELGPWEEFSFKNGATPCWGCEGNCVELGPAQIITTIYNAAHLGPDDLGNPEIDEPLARGILRFNLME